MVRVFDLGTLIPLLLERFIRKLLHMDEFECYRNLDSRTVHIVREFIDGV